jgi:poly(3-hydroxyalkanoate) synthetase
VNQAKLAEARRLYHHVCHGGTLTLEDVSFMVEALEEAVYLLNPTDEDMQKKAGVYRVVTALEKLKEKNT